MKTLKDRKFKLLLITALLTIQEISIPQLTSNAFGADTKKVGRTNASATVNTILSGKGAPAASLGNNGDFYIDKVNMNFYGPKTKDLWPLPVSMRGPVGPSGIDGKNGNDGKPGTTTIAAGGGGASTPGPQGPAGPKGDAGDVGPQGPAGSAGPAGATGASGATGPAGPQGLQGPAGPTGPTGPAGDRGLKGDTGSAANVIVKRESFVFPAINQLAQNQATDVEFGSFVAGKFYLVNIYIDAYTNDYQPTALKFSFVGDIVPVFSTSTSGISGLGGNETTHMAIHAIALVDGNSATAGKLKGRITNYSNQLVTDNITLNASGNSVALEVSAIA